jgi:hypothetical protein
MDHSQINLTRSGIAALIEINPKWITDIAGMCCANRDVRGVSEAGAKHALRAATQPHSKMQP